MKSYSRVCSICLILGLVFTIGSPADPPPPMGSYPIPMVFCFRVTDIREVAGDPEGDRFEIEFEILNWSNRDVDLLEMSLNTATTAGYVQRQQAPFIVGASVDINGRPLGSGNDDANFPPTDGTSGSKTGQDNNWLVDSQTSTSILWSAPPGSPYGRDGLPPNDILGVGSATNACILVPGCNMVAGSPVVADDETVDNSLDQICPAIPCPEDNVLDGFVIDVDDFDPGEIVSFNWFTLWDGSPVAGVGLIGSPAGGNPFGFGVFNITRGSSGLPLWQRVTGAAAGPGSNSGMGQASRDMFVSSTSSGEDFSVELGAAVLGPFVNPSDGPFGVTPNGEFTPIFQQLTTVTGFDWDNYK